MHGIVLVYLECALSVCSAFDGSLDTETLSTNTSSHCSVGIDMGVNRRAILERVRFYPSFGQASTLRGSKVQGSLDGRSLVSCVSRSMDSVFAKSNNYYVPAYCMHNQQHGNRTYSTAAPVASGGTVAL